MNKYLITIILASTLFACDSSQSGKKDAQINLGGTLTPFATSAADGDVNDPFATLVQNNSIATAQTVPNPLTLGGYLNLPGRGAEGATFESGDIIDIYKVKLSAGQTVTLHISEDPLYNDMELLLIDAGFNLLNGSFGNTATEAFTVNASDVTGEHYIAVVMCGSSRDSDYHCTDSVAADYQGASNYILSIGQGVQTSGIQPLTLNAAFVPGEMLVRYRPQPSSNTANPVSRLRLDREPGRDQTSPVAGSLNKKLRRNLDREKSAKLDTLRAIKAMARHPEVEFAEPNYLRQPLGIPNDPNYPLQWHYPLINLPQAWDITSGDSSVIVAVIDTGIVLSHPDLQGQLLPGFDFVSDPDSALDGDGIDNNPDDPGDLAFNGLSSFHGTHVAGTIGAATSAPGDANTGIGVAGISWQGKIMPVRALGHLGGTSYDIQQAILYAAGLPNVSGQVPAQRADVINLSLGAPLASQAEQDAINQAIAQGVIIVAAAGNEHSSTPVYPASYDGVISVTAVDINKQLAPYANYGEFIDIAAPGGNSSQDVNGDGFGDGILSTSASDFGGKLEYGYSYENGTSMAAPHVAGVIALMKSIDPSLDSAKLQGHLSSGQLTEDLGTPGRDNNFGWGMIDAYSAVQAAGGQPSGSPFIYTAFSGLNFSYNLASMSFSVNRGGAPDQILSVDAATDNADWLTLTPPANGTNLGTYVAAVDRSNLAEGTYHATINVNSSANNIEIPVIMQVANRQLDISAGYIWIVLVDPSDGETLDVSSSAVSQGQYDYLFRNVTAGDYLVVAGTDADNDGFICDEGEACGAYPTLDVLSSIHVGDNSLTDINFNIGFNAIISLASLPNNVIPKEGFRRTGIQPNPLREK